jgi:DNA-binding CsgD family transcriptional regulator
MIEVSKMLLSLYDEAQHAPGGGFVLNSLKKIQKVLPFDSAGVVSLNVSKAGALQYTAAHAMNVSPEEKLKARLELNLSERVVPGRGLVGSDPLFVKSFNNRGNSHFISLEEVEDKKLVKYATDTGSINALCLVTDAKGGGLNAISLWRSTKKHVFRDSDTQLANVLLPHLISAMGIHRKVVAEPEVSVNRLAFPDPVICFRSGFINFIHPDALHLLQSVYPGWNPPFLPKVIWDGLKSNTQMLFDNPRYLAKAKILDELVVVYFYPKSLDERLTKTEQKVANLLANGATYKEVSALLGSSLSTVRNQAHSIYRKLKVDRKAGLATALLMNGHAENR